MELGGATKWRWLGRSWGLSGPETARQMSYHLGGLVQAYMHIVLMTQERGQLSQCCEWAWSKTGRGRTTGLMGFYVLQGNSMALLRPLA